MQKINNLLFLIRAQRWLLLRLARLAEIPTEMAVYFLAFIRMIPIIGINYWRGSQTFTIAYIYFKCIWTKPPSVVGESSFCRFLSFIAWMFVTFQKGASFLNQGAKLKHNDVGIGSVFVNSAGEWKLGNFGKTQESGADDENDTPW